MLAGRKRFELFDYIVIAVAVLMIVIILYPLWLVLINSVSDPAEVALGKVVLFPKGFNLDGYKYIFRDKSILTGYANTIFYTVFGTLINLLVTIPAGYVLTKSHLIGHKVISTLFLITMYFSGGLVPTFLVVTELGLYNSRWAILLLGAFNMYNCIICRSFFAALPRELEESAKIDGATPIRTFVSIIMPLSKALVGVMTLYFAVDHWNSYFNAMIYLVDEDKKPLQLFLRKLLVLAQISSSDMIDGAAAYAETEALIRYGVIVVSALPLLIIYPFLQKYFDKGVLIGSVKG